MYVIQLVNWSTLNLPSRRGLPLSQMTQRGPTYDFKPSDVCVYVSMYVSMCVQYVCKVRMYVVFVSHDVCMYACMYVCIQICMHVCMLYWYVTCLRVTTLNQWWW